MRNISAGADFWLTIDNNTERLPALPPIQNDKVAIKRKLCSEQICVGIMLLVEHKFNCKCFFASQMEVKRCLSPVGR